MSELEVLAESIRVETVKQREVQVEQDLKLIKHMLEIYDLKALAGLLNQVSSTDWTRDTIKKWVATEGKVRPLTEAEVKFLTAVLPSRPKHYDNPSFKFADLFAGIGGIRKGFEDIGGECIFTSEWNKYSAKTYKANWYCSENHVFNEDIRDVTLSNEEKFGAVSEEEAIKHIQDTMPDINVLLAGFPCQPFSLAGVSKKNSLGRAHGFECETQGTLFFDVEMIIKAKRPEAFLLENVKNLKSHDKGKTFKIIKESLHRLGYHVADVDFEGPNDPKIIDAKKFLPQHRERIVLVGFRKDLNVHNDFTLADIKKFYPEQRPTFKSILDPEVEDKYTLTPRLWEYLYEYAKKHAAKGNGFGFGLVNPEDPNAYARTLSARYHKDGSEILIDHKKWDMALAEADFDNEQNQANRPRRLTPRECARIMGFEAPLEDNWTIPVSDTQAYRQFGNSVVVPVFSAVAKLMKFRIHAALAIDATEREKELEAAL